MTYRITNLDNVMTAALATPWAILPDKLADIQQLLSLRASGHVFTAEEIEARVGDRSGGRQREAPDDVGAGGVAVIPLSGTMFPRANLVTEQSGGQSVEAFMTRVRAAVNNDAIRAVVLDVNSPGGVASGVPEAADELFAMRGAKPIKAVVNHMMASAALWLGAQVDEVIVSPSADVGSLGVYMLHMDLSQALAAEGIKPTLVRAGRFKAETLPHFALTPEALANLKERVDETYDEFVRAIARARRTSGEEAIARFGEGRLLSAKRAVDAGLADRVGTLASVIDELTRSAGTTPLGRSGPVVALGPASTPQADSSAGSTVPDPSSGTSPAPQAEETTVDPISTPAPSGANAATTPPSATAPNAEAERVSRLADLAALRPECSHRLPHWIRDRNVTYEVARAEVERGIAPPPEASGVVVGATREAQAPWPTLGHFALAVANAARNPGLPLDIKLAAAAGMNQSTGSQGGFTVPAQFGNAMWMGLFEDPTSLLGMCDAYPVEGDFLELPAIDEATRANGTVYGGVYAYWINEADTINKTKPKTRKLRLEPQELAAIIPITQKLLDNSPLALGSYIDRMGRGAIDFRVNEALVGGNGVGKPEGLTASKARVVQAKETNQPAGTILPTNVSKMWTRMPAAVRRRAVWLHNTDCEVALDDMSTVVKNVAGTENVGGYESKVFDAERRTLKGRPLIANDHCEALGTEGDLILVDPLSIAVGLRRAGIKTAESMHMYFDTAQMAFRFMFDIDARNWLAAPITPAKGSTKSSIVTLATRA